MAGALVEAARGEHERVRGQDLLGRLVVLADGEVPAERAQRQERSLDDRGAGRYRYAAVQNTGMYSRANTRPRA